MPAMRDAHRQIAPFRLAGGGLQQHGKLLLLHVFAQIHVLSVPSRCS